LDQQSLTLLYAIGLARAGLHLMLELWSLDVKAGRIPCPLHDMPVGTGIRCL
jgi:hypothetical protein